MSPNPLSNLKIDYWYKALVVIATAILILSLTVDLKNIENNIIQLISLGSLFIGIGEWINHPLQTKIVPPNVYIAPGGAKITSHNRKPSLLGNLIDILGFIIICIGIVKIFYKGSIIQ